MDRFEEPIESGVRWWVQDGVLVLRSGRKFTSDDLMNALREGAVVAVASLPVNVLFDNRFSEERATSDEIRRRAQGIAARRDLFGPRVAVVVSDALHYGLARMGGAYLEPHAVELQVFETPAEALAWLEGRPDMAEVVSQVPRAER